LVFASLSEQLGLSKTTLDAASHATAIDVWQSITTQPLTENILIAINQAYAHASDTVADNDEVAFFPPVTGG
jgi:molybdopterin converting factor small subunit